MPYSNTTNQVLQRVIDIREQINHPWKQELIFSDRIKWDKVCISMDVLEDTQFAIDSFFELPEFSSTNGGYLYLYGLLQAFFLQQDAANNLSQALFGKPYDWKSDYPDLYLIRELRNDATGHPTSRNNDKSFHYLSQFNLSKHSIELASYFPKEKESLFRKFDLFDLNSKQHKSICELLDSVLNLLKKDLQNHKKKFKSMKLNDLIPNNLPYYITKVNEGIYNNHPLAEMNFRHLENSYEKIKSELIKRYNTLDVYPGVKLQVKKLDLIFSRIDEWIKNKNLHKNTEAEIFMSSLYEKYKELGQMLKEIDDEFQTD